jgi:hypothetical protein
MRGEVLPISTVDLNASDAELNYVSREKAAEKLPLRSS